MSRKLIISAVVFGIVASIAYLGYYLYSTYYLPSTIKLPPPLENVEFPLEQTQYPEDWINDLRYPEEFVLVESTSGTLPEGASKGWGTKLRYNGKPSEAANALSKFLEENKWNIVEKSGLDSGGFLILIQRDQGSGIIIVDFDPNDPSQSLIIATIFP